MSRFSLPAAILLFSALAACDLGPNGLGTAPPGVSQAEYEARVRAEREARRERLTGSRPGVASR